jgi:hypothetical protein
VEGGGGRKMLIFCDECGRYLGEVRPFWDRSISERTCEKCYGEFEEKGDGFYIGSEEMDKELMDKTLIGKNRTEKLKCKSTL